MDGKEHDLNYLALQASNGDRDASATLRLRLEKQLACIVRNALRSGRDSNPLARRVLAEARRVAGFPRHPGNEASEYVVSQVVRRLGESIANGLSAGIRPKHWSVDTVVGV
jgi:hypothetical protein